MIDKLGHISEIIKIIRNQSAKATGKINKQSVSEEALQSHVYIKPSREELKKIISTKLKALPGNTNNTAKSKDIFLESVILWEFGNQIANDPAFPEIKSRILETIKNNPVTSNKLDNLIQQLSK